MWAPPPPLFPFFFFRCLQPFTGRDKRCEWRLQSCPWKAFWIEGKRDAPKNSDVAPPSPCLSLSMSLLGFCGLGWWLQIRDASHNIIGPEHLNYDLLPLGVFFPLYCLFLLSCQTEVRMWYRNLYAYIKLRRENSHRGMEHCHTSTFTQCDSFARLSLVNKWEEALKLASVCLCSAKLFVTEGPAFKIMQDHINTCFSGS